MNLEMSIGVLENCKKLLNINNEKIIIGACLLFIPIFKSQYSIIATIVPTHVNELFEPNIAEHKLTEIIMQAIMNKFLKIVLIFTFFIFPPFCLFINMQKVILT